MKKLKKKSVPVKLGNNFVQENKSDILKVYKIYDNPLGTGAFGEVRKALNMSINEVRAIKILKKSQLTTEELNTIFEEINIMKNIDHPNVVRIYEYLQDEESIYIVMELVNGGELFDAIIDEHHFNEKKSASIMYQLLSIVNYLHKNGVCHRDLKPENILYDGTTIKLIDFGASNKF